MRTYERGNIYWSAATGAHIVWGAILVKYSALGGPGALGFPTTDEVGVAGGARSTFTRGSVFWSAATGARMVWGAILARYDALGGPGWLGFPHHRRGRRRRWGSQHLHPRLGVLVGADRRAHGLGRHPRPV